VIKALRDEQRLRNLLGVMRSRGKQRRADRRG
jgi:hypothetical protein